MKKLSISLLVLFLFAMLMLSGCAQNAEPVIEEAPTIATPEVIAEEAVEEQVVDESVGAIHFVDDMGNTIDLDQACEKMIVLYSAHVENLYSLGVGDNIIGGYKTAIYPPDAATKPAYSYKSDPEKVIAAEPDCVLIRPFINRKSPDFVAALEKAGLQVISLYPESFDLFDEYIMNLGMLSGTEEVAAELLEEFYAKIDNISKITAPIEPKKHAYFESTQTNYRTVTTDSMPARAIEFAGGLNIASDVEPITEGSSIASFGIEKILMHAEEIDVYITQRGAMNAGGNTHTITIREGFENIKAVQTGDILEINEKLISSPTFRYYKGVNEIARTLYPEIMDELDSYRSDELITREGYAAVLVRYTHRQIYVPSSSRYYTREHRGHTFGLFQDIPWNHPSFDYVETAVLAGLVDGKENDEGEYFDPDTLVTKDEFAKTIYIMGEFERQADHIQIDDLDSVVNSRIVQILVDNGVFELEDGKFYPETPLTYNELIDTLDKLNLE